MTGCRGVPLLVGLWAVSAFGQTASTVIVANQSVPLDGGFGPTRAYVATAGGTTPFAITNAGEDLEVYNATTGGFVTAQGGTYSTFAVADNIPIGTTTYTTVVVAAAPPVTLGCASTSVCLDIFFWDPLNGFVLQTTAATSVLSVTAMGIDATSSPIRIYFAVNSPSNQLYEQDITVDSSTGIVGVAGLTGESITPSDVQGLAVDTTHQVAYLSDSNSNLYFYNLPLPPPGNKGGAYSTPSEGSYSQVAGLYFVPAGATGVEFLLGGGIASGIIGLTPGAAANSDILIGGAQVLAVGTGRVTQPTGASVNALADLTLVTEDRLTADAGGTPWLHLIANNNIFPDGGAPLPTDAGADGGSDGGSSSDGGTDGGTSGDAGGIPTIPIIAPGPGAAPQTTNSCNCSSAGSAPALLALLLPLLLPRRRR